jgi:pyruvate/2-oxoglutarate dehydrogenase complex dihydrolipoamide acyltransferase (E2) component
MKEHNGYKISPLSFNRRAVRASASITKEKNTIHGLTEIDITIPWQLIREHFERTGEKLSFTAYIVSCLAQVMKDFPQFNSFIKGRNLVLMENVTISVLVERDIDGEKVPEPIGIQDAHRKSFLEIHREIREAKSMTSNKLGTLSGMEWFRFIPDFLLKTFIRFADKNISMGTQYGKVAVTAIGMFSKEATWFIPHGSATVLITVGSMSQKVVEIDGKFVSREHISITASFDHDIVDGAPAARFLSQLAGAIKEGEILQKELGNIQGESKTSGD